MNCPSCQHPNRPAAHFCANCRAPLLLQDKYRIARLLGRGGYGAVYQAEHSGLGGALYAIKELLPDSTATPEQRQAASDQFRLEASILAKLSHPTLPKVMDFFTERNRDYLVMEYIEGDTLEECLTRTHAPFAESQVLAWAQELCDVLAYLHTRHPNPVIHRDVKPSNIKITPNGRLELIDFGIAKLLVAGVGTRGAARAVSPPYSPMEQYGKGTDARSDIYALGVTLYELLTNRLPPEAPDRVSEPVISLRQWNPALASNTEAIVLKAMAEKAVERFQSAVEMKRALTAPRLQTTAPVQPPAPYAPPPPPAYTPPVPPTVPASGKSNLAQIVITGAIIGIVGLCVLGFGVFILKLAWAPAPTPAPTAVPPTMSVQATSAPPTLVPTVAFPTAAPTAAPPTPSARTTSIPPTIAPTLASTQTRTQTPSPVASVAGTVWSVSCSWKDQDQRFDVTFNAEGTLLYSNSGGKWEQKGNSITFDVNDFSFWNGTIAGNTMTGTMTNRQGNSGTFSAVRH